MGDNGTPPVSAYTKKPLVLSAEMTLTSLTAAWAVENREAVSATLRSVLNLGEEADLVITQIQKARRRLTLSFAPTPGTPDPTTEAPAAATPKPVATNPGMQGETTSTTPAPGGEDQPLADGSGGVRIVFIIGVTNREAFEAVKTGVQSLSIGSPRMLASFISTLDRELQLEGKEPVELDATSIVVKQPRVEKTKEMEKVGL